MLIVIIAYHVITCTTIIAKFTQSTVGKVFETAFKNDQMRSDRTPPSGNDGNRFHDLLDIIRLSSPVNMKDWKSTSTEKQNKVMQTYSVVDAPEHLISSSEPVIEMH